MALRRRAVFVDRLPRFRGRLVRAGAVSRPRLLSVGRCRADPHACAHAGRHARRGKRQPVRRDPEGHPPDHPAGRTRGRWSTTSAFPVSGINMTYNNTGTIGPQDGDIQIKLSEDHRPTAEYVRTLARGTAGTRFPGVTFSFLPADIISQILNFGAPAPIDVQIRGPNLARQLRLCAETAAPAAARSGPGRRAHPAVARQPGLQRRCRPHARAICRRHRARRDQQHGGQSRRSAARSRRPTGSIPNNGVSYSIVMQTPQYQMDSLNALKNLPITAAGARAADARRHRRHQSRARAARSSRNTTSSR